MSAGPRRAVEDGGGHSGGRRRRGGPAPGSKVEPEVALLPAHTCRCSELEDLLQPTKVAMHKLEAEKQELERCASGLLVVGG